MYTTASLPLDSGLTQKPETATAKKPEKEKTIAISTVEQRS
jgi:hypothetical protein